VHLDGKYHVPRAHSSPSQWRPHAKRYDNAIAGIICKLLRRDLDPDSPSGALVQARIQLSLASGGLGMGSADRLSSAAYLASLALVGYLVPEAIPGFDTGTHAETVFPEAQQLIAAKAFKGIEGFADATLQDILAASLGRGMQTRPMQRAKSRTARQSPRA
jgi:hypothetical protein